MRQGGVEIVDEKKLCLTGAQVRSEMSKNANRIVDAAASICLIKRAEMCRMGMRMRAQSRRPVN